MLGSWNCSGKPRTLYAWGICGVWDILQFLEFHIIGELQKLNSNFGYSCRVNLMRAINFNVCARGRIDEINILLQ